MELRRVKSMVGYGDDGKVYVIHAYRRQIQLPEGVRILEAINSIYITEEGAEVWCIKLEPPEFLIPRTGVKVQIEKPG